MYVGRIDGSVAQRLQLFAHSRTLLLQMIRQYSHEYHFPPVAPPSVEYDDDDISVLGEDDGTDWGKLEAAPSPLETPSYATTVSPSNFSQKSSVLDLDGILETLPADWW